MDKLAIILPNKQVRYVTNICENDASCSIYESRALEATKKNIIMLQKALNKYPNCTVKTYKEKKGCYVEDGKIKCYGR